MALSMKILCWIDLPQTLWPRGLTWLQPGSWSLLKDFCEFSVSGAPMLLCTYSVTPVGPQSAFQPPRSWMTGPAQAFFLSFLFFFFVFIVTPRSFLVYTTPWPGGRCPYKWNLCLCQWHACNRVRCCCCECEDDHFCFLKQTSLDAWCS